MSSVRKRVRLVKTSRPAGVPSIKALFEKHHERIENESHASDTETESIANSNNVDLSESDSGSKRSSESIDLSSDSENESGTEPAHKRRKTGKETSLATNKHKSNANVRKRKFPSTWLKTYCEWLEFDTVDYVMFCKLCRKHKKPGIWATCGTDNFRYVDLYLLDNISLSDNRGTEDTWHI